LSPEGDDLPPWVNRRSTNGVLICSTMSEP
jgi:hypothetical protein